MECSTRDEGRFKIVSLAGEVDLHYSPQARQQILDLLNKNNHLLVDLSQVAYIDSSGIASLVEGFQLARSKNLDFGLLGISDAVRQVLELARLDKVFKIINDVTEFTDN